MVRRSFPRGKRSKLALPRSISVASSGDGCATGGASCDVVAPLWGLLGGLMVTFLSGTAVLLITSFVFWKCLPRDGKMHRFVDTEWEPYIGVAFCSAIALSFTMILAGLIDVFG